MSRKYGWLLLILLVGAFLRIALITEAPPGLTHDEADHGVDAWGVVNGVRPIYFTVGYGREPLYDYTTAGLMAFLGPSFLAGRLTASFYSIVIIAGAYSWTSLAFNRKLALYTAAGLAVSFWAVMTGRHSLRSITLPAIFVLSVIYYWRAVTRAGKASSNAASNRFFGSQSFNFMAAGLLLGLAFYAYIPSRIIWLLFPLMLPFLAAADRKWFSRVWPGTLLMLLVAGLVALPLIIYLLSNPGVEVRLDELSLPLTTAAQGNLDPLLKNIGSGLGIISFTGDSQWRYNIPGQPLLPPLMSVLFFVGLGAAVWRIYTGLKKRSPPIDAVSAFFSLTWLFLGLVPVLLTGSDFSTPRAEALQPVIYLFPALALSLLSKFKWPLKWLPTAIVLLVFTALFAQTVRNYFYIWASEPEVRVQYESSLVTALEYLDQTGEEDVAVSTTTPEKFHSPAVALLVSGDEDLNIRWFNGSHSLLIPAGPASSVIFSGFASLSPFLEPYFQAPTPEIIPTEPSDIDAPLLIYRVNSDGLHEQWQDQFSNNLPALDGGLEAAEFGSSARLIGYDLQTPEVAPGEQVRLATLWQLIEPFEEAVMFTHILGEDGMPITQDDRLDAPGLYWQEGDYLIQLHQLDLPEDAEPGEYPLIVGIYSGSTFDRLPVLVNGSPGGDHIELSHIQVRD